MEIIRVNGDGTVRMLYDGKKAYANGVSDSGRQVGTSAFNAYWNDNTYVGYMYGDHTKFQVTDSGSKTFGYSGLSPTTKYVFGTSYTFDQASRSFKPSGTITTSVPSTGTVGLYTCFSTSTSGSCQRMHKVTKFNSTTNLQVRGIEYNSISVENAHSNVNPSTMKTYLEDWYKNNLLSYDSKILKDAVFCNDRTISTYGNGTYQNQGYGIHPTLYNYTRFYAYEGSTIGNPRLTCANMRDKFSASTTKGNGLMNYPIGLLTADEVNLAGGRTGYMNTLYYLYSGTSYWTMSPSQFNGESGLVDYYVQASGAMRHEYTRIYYGVRLSFF